MWSTLNNVRALFTLHQIQKPPYLLTHQHHIMVVCRHDVHPFLLPLLLGAPPGGHWWRKTNNGGGGVDKKTHAEYLPRGWRDGWRFLYSSVVLYFLGTHPSCKGITNIGVHKSRDSRRVTSNRGWVVGVGVALIRWTQVRWFLKGTCTRTCFKFNTPVWSHGPSTVMYHGAQSVRLGWN